MKVDTGAKCNVMSLETSKRVTKVDKEIQPLLGFHACMNMGVVKMSPDVHQVTMESRTDINTQILTEYNDLFSDELRDLPVTYSMTVDPKIQLVIRPAHRIPDAMQERVKA
ncbi:hypothetical protein AOLI_G00065650 [Acnodon oligacanthus]